MRVAHTLALLAFALPLLARAAEPDADRPDAAQVDDTHGIARPAADPVTSLGEPIPIATLDAQRGGDDNTTNIVHITGEVTDNSATNVATGANSIREGSFENSSGITTVVQNTGANVLIQSATIVNVQFVDPGQ